VSDAADDLSVDALGSQGAVILPVAALTGSCDERDNATRFALGPHFAEVFFDPIAESGRDEFPELSAEDFFRREAKEGGGNGINRQQASIEVVGASQLVKVGKQSGA
jgi:hypothetical protein